MTVSSSNNRNIYNGDSSTTVFPYTFRILDQTQVLVQLKNTTTGVTTDQVLTTNYTVSGVNAAAGGNITFIVAPASGYTIIITRSMPFTQETDYTANGPFLAESHEDALDELTMTDQELKELSDRSLKFDSSTTGIDPTFPSPSGNANKYVAVNSGGTGFQYTTLTGSLVSLPLSIANGGTGSASGDFQVPYNPADVDVIWGFPPANASNGKTTGQTGGALILQPASVKIGFATNTAAGKLNLNAGLGTGTQAAPSDQIVFNYYSAAAVNAKSYFGNTGLTIGTIDTTSNAGRINLVGIDNISQWIIRAPASGTGGGFTLPVGLAAANGYVLSSTTAGVTSWVAPSSDPTTFLQALTAVTVATNDKVIIRDTSAADALQYVTTQSIADLALNKMFLIGSLTPSGVASTAFTGIDSTYQSFMLVFQKVNPATAAAYLTIVVGEGGTPTYNTSNYFEVCQTVDTSGTVTTTGSGTANTSITLGQSGGATGGVSGVLYIPGPMSTASAIKPFVGQTNHDTGSGFRSSTVFGVYNGTANALTAIKFAMNTGNISAGTITLYGLKNT